ncbi:MAG: hypothetical protein Q9208_002882 [Pyrenodesmia sp. 3 TL-2023]
MGQVRRTGPLPHPKVVPASSLSNVSATQIKIDVSDVAVKPGSAPTLFRVHLDRQERRFEYKVPTTETSLLLKFFTDTPLNPRRVRDLLSRALSLVISILDVAGDGVVPDQLFFKNLDYVDNYRINFAIWSDRIGANQMTYGIVKDALVGLMFFMVTSRYAFRGIIAVSHAGLENVAYASTQEFDRQ